MVKDVVVSKGKVHVHVELTTPACPLKDRIAQDVRAAAGGLEGVEQVTVEFSAQVRGTNREGANSTARTKLKQT